MNSRMERYDVSKSASISTISDVETEFVKKRIVKIPLAGAWRMFADFTKNSTVHGVKYLGERRRHWSERIFWIIVFLISVTGCSVLIVNMYNEWQNKPFISSENSTEIWQIPFPAVTICPETKVISKHLNFTNSYQTINGTKLGGIYNLKNDELKKLEALAQICEPNLFDHDNINSGLELDEIVSTLQAISPKVQSTFRECYWERNWQYCDVIFPALMTEEGSCFTFNMLNSSEIFRKNVIDEKFVSLNHNKASPNWSPQEKYKTKDEITYPRRVLGLERNSGLKTTLLHKIKDTDYICREYVQGYKVIIHNPGDIPRVSKDFFRVPLNMAVSVTIKPNLITTSKRLINESLKRRQCFFEYQKYLRFFKVYTQSNCELECLSNFTLNACGCVKFSMPRDNVTTICSQEQVQCYNNAAFDFIKEESFQLNKTSTIQCNCLPSCTSINYGYEIHQYDLKSSKEPRSRLSIFFKEPRVTTTERSEIYGWTGFLASCGGILGLFMGVSLLSVIEIIYYFTLRLACNRQTFNETKSPIDKSAGIKINISQNYQQIINLANARTN